MVDLRASLVQGGKTSNWQGGIRVNAWAGGGLIPPAMRGSKLTGLAAVWDACSPARVEPAPIARAQPAHQ
jgi:arylsulfatase I/J